MAVAFLIAANVDLRAQLLSEIEIDPPSTTSDACQFTEVRGVPGTAVHAGTYFLSVNSDAGNFGFANQAVNIGGLVFGANGTITLFNSSFGECPNRTYGTGTTRFNYFSALRVGGGSETYLIVRSTSPLFPGLDLDSNDDGIFNAALGITVLDGFALLVNPEEEFVYGAAAGARNISNTTSLDQPDAVTRFPGDPTPFASAAFFFGELAATPDETVAFEAPRSPNFPTGAVLTPGDGNVPTPTNTAQFSSGAYSDDESQPVTITVNRTGDTAGTLAVTAATSNGSAVGGANCVAGVDFISVSQTLTFAAGVAAQSFPVTLCGDSLIDTFETINLTLSNPVGGGVGTLGTAVVTINDTANQFRNATAISITQGGAASPYPSTIDVTGTTGTFRVRVTLYDFYHALPDNAEVLLVSPNGAKYVLMGDVGGPVPILENGHVTLTFSDFSPGVLPDSGPLMTGSYKPTTCGATPMANFPAPAPVGPYVEPGCTVGRPNDKTLFGNFGGSSNGTWSLFIRDDAGAARPFAPEVVLGEVKGGWGIEILPSTAAGVEVSGRVLTPEGRGLRNATVTITDSKGARRTTTTGSFGAYRFEDIEVGESYVMSVGSKRFRFSSRIIQVNDNLSDVDFLAVQ